MEKGFPQEASAANWTSATEAANRLHHLLREVDEGGRLSGYVKSERFLTAAAAQQQACALAMLFDHELGLASFVQMRSLIESSLRLAWMLDPDVGADVRVSRTLTIALGQRREVDALVGGDESAELVEAIEGCELSLDKNRFGEAISVGGVRHPSPGDMVAYGSGILPPSENGRSLGELYGALSSAAHGGAAVARFLLTRPELPADIHLNAWDIWQATQSALGIFGAVVSRAEALANPHVGRSDGSSE